ncbi:hypothetical protein SAMN04488518_11332 [Pseudovibrio ascidiaceicola]|uniref:SMODS and SLOG-associating 2TM effector domain-containing protein n=1 Tax=Pseudovibrio ascidiaceicola TaxID=285279 RepID=A0A1I4DX13_9HYPH|nr:hypothetical protein [Pseudovibrio ascidiaceicola]SFK97985.1 hypothetical protein SAMN04488518_11332 [Pseudovibrio ascidiaceicola]
MQEITDNLEELYEKYRKVSEENSFLKRDLSINLEIINQMIVFQEAYSKRNKLTVSIFALSFLSIVISSITIISQGGFYAATGVFSVPGFEIVYENRHILLSISLVLLIVSLSLAYLRPALPSWPKFDPSSEDTGAAFKPAFEVRGAPSFSQQKTAQQFTHQGSFIRFNKEISRLETRGMFNLIIGVAATSISSLIIGISVFTIEAQDLLSSLSTLIPRVLLSLLIQSFAVFFLRLYSQSLRDIKYYQNEYTNVEMRVAALDILEEAQIQDEDKILSAATILLNTERNFILKKDESTVDLQKHKTDAHMQEQLFELLKSSLSKVESSNSG